MVDIHKESTQSPERALFDNDWENRVTDIAIEALEDIKECDGMAVYVSWQNMQGIGNVPLLYCLFNGKGDLEKLPRVHIDKVGLKPAHAIMLVTLPSKQPMEGQKLRDFIRREIEIYLRKYNITPHFFSEVKQG